MSPANTRSSGRIGQQQQVTADDLKDQPPVNNKESVEEGSSNSPTSPAIKPSENLEETRHLRRESYAPSTPPSPLLAEPSSPSKRRLHSGTMPSPKKSKSSDEVNPLVDHAETVEAPPSDQCSKDRKDIGETADDGLEAYDKLQAMIERVIAHKHEAFVNKICYDYEATIAADRARMEKWSAEMETMREVIEMWIDDEEKQELAQVPVVDQKWESAMLHRKRQVIRVGKDGNDEIITAPFSEACYVHLAREILHRIRPEDELLPGCGTSDCDFDVELMSDFNLDFMMKIRGEPRSGPADLDAFEAAAWYISRFLLVDREETFRCLAAHPYYRQEKGEGNQCSIKQELINFFDRRFTFQMSQLYGIDVPVDGALLRLGCDFALYEEDRVDCGVFDEATIVEENAKTWAALIEPVIRSKTIEPNISKNCDRVLKTQEEQYNVTLQRALTPISAKRSIRITESEISNFKMITKDALGPEALMVETGSNSGEAELSDTEDDAIGRVNNDSLSLIVRRAGDILLA